MEVNKSLCNHRDQYYSATKQDTSQRRMDELPLDILFNIFTRIPTKLLLQLRCVSKQWCDFIDHPSFANIHATQSDEESIFLLLSNTHMEKTTEVQIVKRDQNTLKASENTITSFESHDYLLEGSCNGLLCFIKFTPHLLSCNNRSESVVLSNPLKREFHLLEVTTQSFLYGFSKFGLGFDSSMNKYKIVRLFLKDTGYNLGAQVQTLGTNSWREISKAPPCSVRGRAIFANGTLYWIIHPYFSKGELDEIIASFDIKNEEFYLISHPKLSSKDCELLCLFDLHGDLGMVDLSNKTKIGIWVLKIYDQKKEWIAKYSIDIAPPEYGRVTDWKFEVIGPWRHGEILLTYCGHTLIYNLNSNVLNGLSETLDTNSRRYTYRPSLISISKVMAHE